MKKLLELLNEYNNNHHNKSDLYYLFEIENGMLFCYDDVTDVQRTMQDEAMVICSKKFGFIQRLVKNNRIDIERLHKIVDYMLVIKENYVNAHDYNSDCLLMLLAIQDKPIEFLITILR